MSDARFTALAVAAEAEALARLLDGGYLELRTGDPPEMVEDVSPGMILASLRFQSPSARESGDGRLDLNLVPDPDAVGGGSAGYFRAYTARRDLVLDGTVGTSGTTLVVKDAYVKSGSRVLVEGSLQVRRS